MKRYHACFAYNSIANHHISAVINGAIILNETASDVLGGNSSTLATSKAILDNLRLGKCSSTAPKEMHPFQVHLKSVLYNKACIDLFITIAKQFIRFYQNKLTEYQKKGKI